MAFGLRIANGADFTQIDNEYSNYAIVEQGTYTANPSGTGTVIPLNTYNTLYGPLYRVFVKPNSASYYNIYFGIATGANFCIWSETAMILDYIICVPMTELATVTKGYGLNVYNSAGKQTYSSTFIPAQLAALWDVPTKTTTSPNANINTFAISTIRYSAWVPLFPSVTEWGGMYITQSNNTSFSSASVINNKNYSQIPVITFTTYGYTMPILDY